MSKRLALQQNGGGIIKCQGKCGKRSTKDIPISVKWLEYVYRKEKYDRKRLPPKSERGKRAFFCQFMKENPKFCAQVNEAWQDIIVKKSGPPAKTKTPKVMSLKKRSVTPQQSIKQSLSKLAIVPYKAEDWAMVPKPQLDVIKYHGTVSKTKTPSKEPGPPNRLLPFKALRDYIRTEFKGPSDVWGEIEVVNKCGPPPAEKKQQGGAGTSSELVNFNPTQEFVRHYFTPLSPYKGMLLWHSTGSGKTCTSIATASSSFEREGYSILWVTRTTLKSDIWKNMFGQICSTVIAEEVKKGFVVPQEQDKRRRLLSRNWLEPMSYKQFSNLLAGNNDYYKKLKERNGAEDVIKKTLIIIDEAHKLYGGDLKAMEKPDMGIMEKLLQNSYRKSGAESARLLIMTATPFTNSPIEMFQLLNLCREKDLFPTTMAAFKTKYMNEQNILSKQGIQLLANQTAGYISYLNREHDPTQFAQPVMIDVPVVMSTLPLDEETTNDVRPYVTGTDKLPRKGVTAEERHRIASLKKDSLLQELQLSARCKNMKFVVQRRLRPHAVSVAKPKRRPTRKTSGAMKAKTRKTKPRKPKHGGGADELTVKQAGFTHSNTVPLDWTGKPELYDQIPLLFPPTTEGKWLVAMIDPDAVGGTYTHYAVYFPTADHAVTVVPYAPPKPPAGTGTHSYFFQLYHSDMPTTNDPSTFFEKELKGKQVLNVTKRPMFRVSAASS